MKAAFLKQVIFLAVFLFCLKAAIDKHQSIVERSTGKWSQIISAFAEQDKAELPAQYLMCGFQHKLKQFSYSWPQCKKKWNRGRRRTKCWDNWEHPLWRSNGFNAVFCSYKNWKDQKQLSFNSNDPNNPGWTALTMCPQGTYAQGFRAGLGSQRGTDMGFNGLQLDCQPLSQASSTIVSRSQTQQYEGGIVSGKRGYFISALQLKYINNDMLTGVKFIFQAAPYISKIVFKYNLNNLIFTPRSINAFQVNNGGQEAIKKQYTDTKEMTTQRTYTQTNSYTKGYRVSASAQISFPIKSLNASAGKAFQYYTQSTKGFEFGQRYESKWTSTRALTFIIPGKTKIVGDFLMYSQTIDLPYTAQVTFVNMNTGQLIGTAQFEGRVNGVQVQKIIVNVTQQPYQNNLIKND